MNDLGLNAVYVQQRTSLRQARQALATAETVRQLKFVRDQADELRAQIKGTNQDLELLNLAGELKLQAERQIGRRLIELKLRGGDRRSTASREPLKLRDLGVDKNQSARWQLEASVPESIFCQFLRAAHAVGDEITSAALIRLAKQLKKRPTGSDGGLLLNPASEVASVTSYLPGDSGRQHDTPQRDVRELAELVLDAKNHNQLVANLFESLCERAAVRPEETVCRALRRYLDELENHLESIGKGLRRLASQGTCYASAWSGATLR